MMLNNKSNNSGKKNERLLVTFSQIIKSERTAKNFTQTEMGDFLGFHLASVARWEGGGSPSIKTVMKVANRLKVKINIRVHNKMLNPKREYYLVFNKEGKV